MSAPLPHSSAYDLELRLVDPSRNKYRLYGLTECRTLFGEICLRIQWGRIGHRPLRERSEVFPNEAALIRRRSQLLALRHRHGYRDVPTPSPTTSSESTSPAKAIQREIVESHGLSLHERAVQQLVARWRDATEAIRRYLEERRAEPLDLVDVSTLAAMYVDAAPS